jgi:hypothetical protein
VLEEAGKLGYVPITFEARLAVAEIENRERKTNPKAELVVLEREARKDGFELIAQKAASLQFAADNNEKHS